MRALDLVRRSAVAIRGDHQVREAAMTMEHAGVGALVVLDADDRPLGIVTDRDLVRRAMARTLPPDARVDGVMSAPVITVDADADAHAVYELFRRHAVRRLPVLVHGRFVGMIAVDDLLIHLSADLADLVRPVTGEVLFPQRNSSPPAPVG